MIRVTGGGNVDFSGRKITRCTQERFGVSFESEGIRVGLPIGGKVAGDVLVLRQFEKRRREVKVRGAEFPAGREKPFMFEFGIGRECGFFVTARDTETQQVVRLPELEAGVQIDRSHRVVNLIWAFPG